MPPSESDVRFPYRYGRAGMSAFFCSDAFEYPFDSDRLQGVFPFGRKSIPSNKKGILPSRLVTEVSQNLSLMRPIA